MAWRGAGDGEKVFRDDAKVAMLCCDADVSATNSRNPTIDNGSRVR